MMTIYTADASTFAMRPASKQSWRVTLLSIDVARCLQENTEVWTQQTIQRQNYHLSVCRSEYIPVHAGYISPKVACSVSRADFHRIDKNWITLKKKKQCRHWALKRFVHFHQGDRILWPLIKGDYLKKPADVRFIGRAHEDHVLKQPEEWPVISLLWLQHSQYAVELKKESSSALCRKNTHTRKGRKLIKSMFTCVGDSEPDSNLL